METYEILGKNQNNLPTDCYHRDVHVTVYYNLWVLYLICSNRNIC